MSQFVTGSSLTSARAAAAWVEAILVGELGRRREVTVRETVLRLLTCPELGRPLLCLLHRWPENAASRTACRDDMCRDDCRTVVAPAFAAKNFRHLAGTKAKARWNATTADAPTATDNKKWDPRRVGYYRSRFQEETACLRAAAAQ